MFDFSQNAELHFNFGATPFDFPPQGGYTALTKASKDNVAVSSVASELLVLVHCRFGIGVDCSFFTAVVAGPSAKSRPPNAPFALIIEPSRELAEQTHAQVKKFKKHLPAPHVAELLVMGGVSAKEQIDSLYSGVRGRPDETPD